MAKSLLILLTIFGTACSEPEEVFVTDISWYTEVKFSSRTKRWFESVNPPPFVVHDLDVVRQNNFKYRAIKQIQNKSE